MSTQENDAPERKEFVPEQENQQPGEVTRLLLKWQAGDTEAFNQLTAIVGGELRRRAHHYLRRERAGHTLQTTALVDDVWLRLGGGKEDLHWQNRAHFYAIAADVMRRILVEAARRRKSQKRGGGLTQTPLEEGLTVTVELDLDLLALDEALAWLKQRSERKYQVVVLRFFAGLTNEEIAAVLKISPLAVRSDWETAKRWLFGRLNGKEAVNGAKAF
ncbi:MAG: sigma-70 family RNA polymerase sigma factor [Acidobacteria bacterium]|nr:sigma-70 family RNA polymerase sigma factor [Acidobacteriota bacterium]MBI3421618.1 sigma-70 family RNA polymerase sigma factor [Acidobacteriota bacterium]